MVFSNSKGAKWYLNAKQIVFGRGRYKRINYFFTKEKPPTDVMLPLQFTVTETKTGMPVLKKL